MTQRLAVDRGEFEIDAYRSYAHSEKVDQVYQPVIVEDLLNGLNEWRDVQDIVRLTFKALSDVVKSHGASLREIEHVLTTKASKSELNSGLSLKANVNDISKAIAEVQINVESKIGLTDLQHILDDKVNRNELQYALSNKISIDELRTVLDQKVSVKDFESELRQFKHGFESLQHDYMGKVQSYVTDRELQRVHQILEGKADLTEMNEMLSTKANKQSVATALHRKANRTDVESWLARKADTNELQALYTALESKAEYESLELLSQEIQTKANNSDVHQLISNHVAKLPDRGELDAVVNNVQNYKRDIEHKTQTRVLELENVIQSLRNELEDLQQVLNSSIQRKADARDIERLQQTLNRKADSEHVTGIIGTFKTDVVEMLNSFRNDNKVKIRQIEDGLYEKLVTLEETVAALEDQVRQVHDNITSEIENHRQNLDSGQKAMQSFQYTLRQDIEGEINNKIRGCEQQLETIKQKSKSEIGELRSALLREIESKAGLSEIQQVNGNMQREISRSQSDLKEEVRNWLYRQERDLTSLVEQRASQKEVQNLISERTENLQRALQSRVTPDDIDTLRQQLDDYKYQLRNKVDKVEVDKIISVMKENADETARELNLKANIREISDVLDNKAFIDDVNKALQELHSELDTKITVDEYNQHLADQALINEALCSENCVARWIWKSGTLKNGYGIPWEIQSVNTCPDNFLWEKDKTSVLCVAPGLYEISFGFYARKKPTVQLLVNGEPAITVGGPQNTRQWGRHSSGNVLGLTNVDFLALPTRCRLSLSYTGDGAGEGFLNIRKLQG